MYMEASKYVGIYVYIFSSHSRSIGDNGGDAPAGFNMTARQSLVASLCLEAFFLSFP